MKTVQVLLPTLNEEKAIKKVIQAIPIEAIKKIGYETRILVIDGHSKDKTAKIAKEEGAEVIMQEGKGKGDAFQTALKELKKRKPEITVMLDADNTYDPAEIPQMILPLIIGQADITVGAREGKTHYLGNTILTGIANNLFKNKIKDLCTGYWGFNTKAIRKINITAKGFDLESDLFSQASKNELIIKNVNIRYRERIGTSKLTRKDALTIIGRIIRNARDWHPMALFGTTGLILLTTGIIFGIKVVNDYLTLGYVNAIGTFILTVFLAIMGFFLIGMGLILDLLERRT